MAGDTQRDTHWKVSAVLASVASVSLLAIPKLQPACDGLMPTAMGGAVPMRCHFSYRVEVAIALAALLVALTLFVLGGREARRLAGAFLLILGTLAAVIPQPWIIGTCRGGSCHTGGIAYGIIGGVLALVGLQAACCASTRRDGPEQVPGPDA